MCEIAPDSWEREKVHDRLDTSKKSWFWPMLENKENRERCAQSAYSCIINRIESERASYNGSIEASQASDVGSIPIARSINLDDSVDLARLSYLNSTKKRRSWTV